MEDIRREIRFYGTKPGKSDLRRVRRQLDKWLLKKGQLSGYVGCESELAYRVSIERENDVCLSCKLHVQVGNQSWESHDVGKSVQDALFHALQHLERPVSSLMNARSSFALGAIA